MEHFVSLKRIPEILKFPTEFQDRIRYDAVHHRLVFQGFMRKTDYDALARISGDLEYLDALQHLFSDATFSTPRRKRWRNPALIVIGLILAAALGSVWLWHVNARTNEIMFDGADYPAGNQR